ncbi:MAG: hypothetical protein ACTHM9_04160 [Gemmatimonadales bacterium]
MPRSAVRADWPLVVSRVLLLGCIGALVAVARSLTQGHFAYALDDAYIHLAMARTLAESGVWGVTPHAFSSSSSSPLWTALLACLFTLAGPIDILPLVLNTVCACLVLALYARALRRAGVAGWSLAAGLIVMIVGVPLVPLALIGMEHTLNVYLSLAFLICAARALDPDARSETRRPYALLGLAALLAASRYEGLFLVAAACLLFAWRRRPAMALALAAVAWLPVIAYGLFSRSHGSLFLPNSLLLKAAPPRLDSAKAIGAFAGNAVSQLAGAPHLVVVAVACLVPLLLARDEARDYMRPSIAMVLIALAFHVALARVGWFYRYEAYLMACGIAAATLGIARLLRAEPPRTTRARALAGLALAAAAVPLVYRGTVAMSLTPKAAANVYQQQIQMGRFVHRYYRGTTVAVNDIGAVAYYGEAGLLDVGGLADVDVLLAQRAGHFTSATMDSMARARRARMAIVYPGWLERFGGIPSSWTAVARWTVPGKAVVLGDASVTFYAIEQGEAARLVAHLRDFSTTLPPGVRQEFAGTSTTAP